MSSASDLIAPGIDARAIDQDRAQPGGARARHVGLGRVPHVPGVARRPRRAPARARRSPGQAWPRPPRPRRSRRPAAAPGPSRQALVQRPVPVGDDDQPDARARAARSAPARCPGRRRSAGRPAARRAGRRARAGSPRSSPPRSAPAGRRSDAASRALVEVRAVVGDLGPDRPPGRRRRRSRARARASSACRCGAGGSKPINVPSASSRMALGCGPCWLRIVASTSDAWSTPACRSLVAFVLATLLDRTFRSRAAREAAQRTGLSPEGATRLRFVRRLLYATIIADRRRRSRSRASPGSTTWPAACSPPARSPPRSSASPPARCSRTSSPGSCSRSRSRSGSATG